MRRFSSTLAFGDTATVAVVLAIALLALTVALPVTAAGPPADGAAGAPAAIPAKAAVTPAPAVPDRFTAKTVAMAPAGTGLRIDVMRWSDDAARAAVVAAIGADEPVVALAKLPTLGYVWTEGMP